MKASAEAELAQAAADAAATAVAAEQAELGTLNAEFEALSAIAEPTPEEQARLDALPGLISEQQGAVDAAQLEADEAQAAADEAAVGTDEASLEAALNEMANKPVDDEVVEWATGVLDGKIDEMKAVLEAAAATETLDPAAPVDPATPVPVTTLTVADRSDRRKACLAIGKPGSTRLFLCSRRVERPRCQFPTRRLVAQLPHWPTEANAASSPPKVEVAVAAGLPRQERRGKTTLTSLPALRLHVVGGGNAFQTPRSRVGCGAPCGHQRPRGGCGGGRRAGADGIRPHLRHLRRRLLLHSRHRNLPEAQRLFALRRGSRGVRPDGCRRQEGRGRERSSSLGTDLNDTYDMRARFQLRVDARAETELGTLRGYAAINFDWDTIRPTDDEFLYDNGFTAVEDNWSVEHAYIELAGFRVGMTNSLFSTFTGYAGGVINDDIIGYGPYDTHQIAYRLGKRQRIWRRGGARGGRRRPDCAVPCTGFRRTRPLRTGQLRAACRRRRRLAGRVGRSLRRRRLRLGLGGGRSQGTRRLLSDRQAVAVRDGRLGIL